MKKTIITSAILTSIIISTASIKTPAPVPAMQFETIGINIYQLPSPTDDGKWKWEFIAWYGVKDNPYMKVDTTQIGMVTKATWAKWENLTMITTTTDAQESIAVALDSANAYRVRNYPNVQ